MDIHAFGKWLMGIGLVVFVTGAACRFLPRVPLIGRLPGDILIKRDHFTFYFPLTTCLLISLALMIFSRLFGHK
jgi:hypothetical protein